MTESETTVDPIGAPTSTEKASIDAKAVDRIAYGNWLFARLPEWVLDSLTPDQAKEIHAVITDPSRTRPPVNIRIGFPFFGRRFFLTIVGGEEKRGVERRKHERHHYPLRTMANVFFILGVGTLFYMVAIFALALHSAIIEL